MKPELLLSPLPGDLPADLPEVLADLPEEPEKPVLLLCGSGPVAEAVASLADGCGFEVDVAHVPPPPEAGAAPVDGLSLDGMEQTLAQRFPAASRRLIVDELGSLVEKCDIGRGHFVCIDIENPDQALEALYQALQSHAFYIGMRAEREERDRLYAILRSRGVPDSELRAVSCPMGLSIGAETDGQKAVAIVAELLAARAGNLQRLRLDN